MNFGMTDKGNALLARVDAFMRERIEPQEQAARDELAANTLAGQRWTPLQTIERLKKEAQAEGLWNLHETEQCVGHHHPRRAPAQPDGAAAGWRVQGGALPATQSALACTAASVSDQRCAMATNSS